MNYLCASYNVSTVHDMVRRLDNIEAEDRTEIVERAKNQFEEVVTTTFREMITDYGRTAEPHMICLQECYPKSPEKKGLVETLNLLDYDLCDAKDTAVAFKRKRFALIQQGSTNSGAIFLDLMDKKKRIALRIISDHVMGFNVKTHKSSTRQLKQQALSEKEKQLFYDNKTDAYQGDRDLAESIQATLPNPLKEWTVLEKVKNAFSKTSIDLVIYGLDANATASYLPKKSRAHGKRLDVFKEYGFICDERDQDFTIIDYNDHVARKYDYLFVKALSGTVQIFSKPVKVDLKDTTSSFSDHRPVLAEICFNLL